MDGEDLGADVDSVKISVPKVINETYPTRGVKSTAQNFCRHYDVTAMRDEEAVLELDVRIFNDGLAYRYVVPGAGEKTISGEASGWHFEEGTEMWGQPDLSNYEGIHKHLELGQADIDMGPPVTLKTEGGLYAAVSEAALLNYSGVTIDADKGSGLLKSEFLDDKEWTVEGGSTTPWRVTMVSLDLNGLVTSDILTNLCPAPSEDLYPGGMNTDYIQPARVVWRWWSRGTGNPKQERKFVDFADSLGYECTLIDAGWEDWDQKWKTVEDIVDYAAEKRVDVWVWKNWNEIKDAETRREFFENVKDIGVVGVKIDYMDSESQDVVNFYTAARKDAAREELMVNFHGAFKPTGTWRTFPNEMTREGIRGLEYNKFNGLLPPDYNATLPFTRLLAQPGDYTPVTVNPDKLGDTTVTHQLATAVQFTSPALHIAEYPSRLLEKKKALDVIKAVPATWDETVVLDCSEIGKLSAIARRRGDTWFLAILNGDADEGRTLEDLDLSFLGNGDWYTCVAIHDASKTEFGREEKDVVEASDSMDVEMLPGGGFVAMFEPRD